MGGGVRVGLAHIHKVIHGNSATRHDITLYAIPIHLILEPPDKRHFHPPPPITQTPVPNDGK